MKRRGVAALTGLLVLSACSGDEGRAVEALRRDARDPESVRVRNLTTGETLGEGAILCGEWNGRNGFGGRGEWQGFILRRNEQHALFVPQNGQDDPEGIREIAKTACPGVMSP